MKWASLLHFLAVFLVIVTFSEKVHQMERETREKNLARGELINPSLRLPSNCIATCIHPQFALTSTKCASKHIKVEEGYGLEVLVHPHFTHDSQDGLALLFWNAQSDSPVPVFGRLMGMIDRSPSRIGRETFVGLKHWASHQRSRDLPAHFNTVAHGADNSKGLQTATSGSEVAIRGHPEGDILSEETYMAWIDSVVCSVDEDWVPNCSKVLEVASYSERKCWLGMWGGTCGKNL